MRPALIIVTGPPASGKSSIARNIARDLGLPYVGKDDIKERLFDTLGVGDRAWSRKLGGATYELLYWTIELFLQAGHSLVAESNFRAQDSAPQLRELQARHPFDAYQVICHVDREVQRARYEARWSSGQRHAGHVDDVSIKDVMQEEPGAYAPMALGGPVIELDTSIWDAIDYDSLIVNLRQYQQDRT